MRSVWPDSAPDFGFATPGGEASGGLGVTISDGGIAVISNSRLVENDANQAGIGGAISASLGVVYLSHSVVRCVCSVLLLHMLTRWDDLQ